MSLTVFIENLQIHIYSGGSTQWHLTLNVSLPLYPLGPAAGPTGPAARPGGSSGPRDGFWSTYGWSREAQAHPAAACPPPACSQVPTPGAGQRGGEAVQPSPLPDDEERPQPHDTLPVGQILPRWVGSEVFMPSSQYLFIVRADHFFSLLRLLTDNALFYVMIKFSVILWVSI